jgi:hypothetical protein
MADEKISQLTPGAPAQSTDIIPIARSGVNFSLQVSDILGQGTSPVIYKGGLLAEFPFTEVSGNTLHDVSGNGNDGTLTGVANWWGRSGENLPSLGLFFDGATHVSLPAALNAARTIVLVTGFNPAGGAFQCPCAGSNDTGSFSCTFANQQNLANSGANLYNITCFAPNGDEFSVPTIQSAGGLNFTAWTLGSASDIPATYDQIWVNRGVYPYQPVQPPLRGNESLASTGQSAGQQSAGVYLLGGGPAGGFSGGFASWYTGSIYYALFYSTYLTPQQIAQTTQGLILLLAQRAVSPNGNTITVGASRFVAVGDSITFGSTTATNYAQYMTLDGSWNWVNIGLPSAQASDVLDSSNQGIGNTLNNWFSSGDSENVASIWYGTNDISGGLTGAQGFANFAAAVRTYRGYLQDQRAYKIIVVSMLSRVGLDSGKNAFNALLRTQWSEFADGFADVAADPNLGADGAYANLTYFTDGVHPTTFAQQHDIAPITQRAINRLYGNVDFSSANTYTSSQTQVDADVCVILGASAGSQTFTLQTSVGYTGQNIRIKNNDTHTWTIATSNSETINGASTVSLAAGASLTLESILVSGAAGGSNWLSV